MFRNYAGMMESADMTDLKSVAQLERASSSLAVRIFANVAELADALGLGPSVVKDVRVRVSPFVL